MTADAAAGCVKRQSMCECVHLGRESENVREVKVSALSTVFFLFAALVVVVADADTSLTPCVTVTLIASFFSPPSSSSSRVPPLEPESHDLTVSAV